MFNFFQAHNSRAAIVLGEFGEVLGIVTIKDVLTFIFGEISGKIRGYDDYQEDEDGFQVPGYMRLIDFHDLTNINIDDPVMTTIGGVVFRLFGSLPKEGDTVSYEGYEFRVLELDGLRISCLHVSPATAGPSEESEPAEEPANETEVLDSPAQTEE